MQIKAFSWSLVLEELEVPLLDKTLSACYGIGEFIAVFTTVGQIYTTAVLMHDCFSFK
jgi:hypothetical protein